MEVTVAPPDYPLDLVRILSALADPARLATVRTLVARGPSPCTELLHAAGLAIGQSTFSHHQRVLREAGVISVRVEGARRIVSVRRAALDAAFPGLLDAVLPPSALSPPTGP
jgi:DNA-binding transcriptional ArsR family regulator